jgi:Domain of unknown function (DUF4340)
MSRGRFVMLLIAAVLVLCSALYLGARRNGAEPRAAGTAFLPGLSTELATVSEIDLRKGSPTPGVTLHHAGTQWTLAQRSDYPADVSKVRKLLLSLADAKVVEEKTSDPANFSRIGVSDPAQPGAAGTDITLTVKDGKREVIVGKPIGEGNFARHGGENRSFTIEPGITADVEPRAWIDSRLIDVPTAQIQSVEEKLAAGTGGAAIGAAGTGAAGTGAAGTAVTAGAGYVLRRLKAGEDGFALEGTPPAGRKLLEPKALAPSPSALSNLTADDVATATDIDFAKSSQATFTLADGNVITITGVAAGDKRWIQVAASKDAALDAKAQKRAFEVASYRYDAIFRPLEQLLVPKETKPPAGAKPPVSRSSPAPTP